MAAMGYESRIRLPRSGLAVGRVGLGSSFGVAPDDLDIAFEHGINYFYWGSIRRPGFGRGVRRLARRARERMVVVLQSYTRWPPALMRLSLETGLRRLGIEYADFLLLGWWNQRPPQWLLDTALELRERGRVRHLMLSGHRRTLFPEVAREGIFDQLMVRYNAAHRGAEREVFPALAQGDARPALCAYTATRWGSLVDPKRTPAGEATPSARHCYRFCLSHPDVDLVLCGPANTQHVHEACRALAEGPLDAEELAWMRRVGDHVYGRAPLARLTD